MKISACLVTRGNVDMQPIVDSLGMYDEVLVWDNSKTPVNEMAHGRYVIAEQARNDIIFFQDDDVILDLACHQLLADSYVDGSVTVNIHPQRWNDVAWVGWGAVLRRDLSYEPHRRYLKHFPRDEMFLTFCDAIMTCAVPVKRVWGGATDLPYAWAEDRTYQMPGYFTHTRPEAIRRAQWCASLP